ncbi:hypothetical protein PBRA_005123 [Plasmodiophora brassicae]|uniref:GATOR1 complex protein NPRL3 C-terminal HTH domain-containing protein n=1 Tax=Plasmodiophora brassicae TaxID=37360 RepID=A0A0G4IMX6_PLABS|nr:hypothetical protein PBRA_005123 [Plasmodiophora brassicae]
MLLAVAGDRGHLVAFSCRSSDADTDELPGNARPQTVARLCCPKVHLCNRLLEFDIDNVKFVSWPVTVDNNDHMTTFNVVAALPKGAYSVRAQHIARATVTQLAAALIHEERRKNYVSNQVPTVHLLLKTRDGDGDRNAQLRISTLARILVWFPSSMDVCQALANGHFRSVRVNDWIHVSVSDPPAAVDGAAVRPYQTVLLLDDAESIQAQLPDDASLSLRHLIRVANPMKSFRDISVDLGMPITHIVRLAAHLVHWGKARILNTLTKHTILTINSGAVVDRAACDSFGEAFPSRSLPDQLSRFAVPKRLEEHLRILGQAAQHQLITVIIYLLRRSLLVLLHTFVQLIPDQAGQANYPSTSVSLYPSSLDSTGSGRFVPTSPLMDVHTPSHPKSSKLKKLFNKYVGLPFFDGRHSIEEIMWRENLSRQEIAHVITEYSDRLCTCFHEGE